MRKSIPVLIIVCFSFHSQAQETLYANDTHTLSLFFPSPIRQAVTGAEHFTFSYNRESGQKFGLLQGNKGDDSNLLVITQDGRAYSYKLEYRKELTDSYRFIKIRESIGGPSEPENVGQLLIPAPVFKKETVPETSLQEKTFKKGAAYVLQRKTGSIKTERKDGLVLRLKELFFHGNEVYMELEIQNRSAIDFEIDVLEVYKINGKRGRRSSHQKVPMEPRSKYNLPNIVRVGQRHNFVYVLPKFTLGNAEKLLMELQEQKGSRMLQLTWE